MLSDIIINTVRTDRGLMPRLLSKNGRFLSIGGGSLSVWSTGAYGTNQASREPQRGTGKHFCGAPNIFTGPLWRNFFWIFLFKMVHSCILYNFWPTAGHHKRRGARGS